MSGLTLSDLLAVLQAFVVVGGGFWIFGRMQLRLSDLTEAIKKLAERHDAADSRWLDHERRLTHVESRLE